MARYLVIETLGDADLVYRKLEDAVRRMAGISWLGCSMELNGVHGKRLVIRTRTKCVKWVRAALATLDEASITLRATGSARKAEALAKSLKPVYPQSLG